MRFSFPILVFLYLILLLSSPIKSFAAETIPAGDPRYNCEAECIEMVCGYCAQSDKGNCPFKYGIRRVSRYSHSECLESQETQNICNKFSSLTDSMINAFPGTIYPKDRADLGKALGYAPSSMMLNVVPFEALGKRGVEGQEEEKLKFCRDPYSQVSTGIMRVKDGYAVIAKSRQVQPFNTRDFLCRIHMQNNDIPVNKENYRVCYNDPEMRSSIQSAEYVVANMKLYRYIKSGGYLRKTEGQEPNISYIKEDKVWIKGKAFPVHLHAVKKGNISSHNVSGSLRKLGVMGLTHVISSSTLRSGTVYQIILEYRDYQAEDNTDNELMGHIRFLCGGASLTQDEYDLCVKSDIALADAKKFNAFVVMRLPALQNALTGGGGDETLMGGVGYDTYSVGAEAVQKSSPSSNATATHPYNSKSGWLYRLSQGMSRFGSKTGGKALAVTLSVLNIADVDEDVIIEDVSDALGRTIARVVLKMDGDEAVIAQFKKDIGDTQDPCQDDLDSDECNNDCDPRKKNPPKSQSPIWNSFKHHRKDIKTNGLSGSRAEFYQWDYTHNDIEVYNKAGKHKGSMCPINGKMYKEPKKGREIEL